MSNATSYTVTVSNPTGIAGYEPEYPVATVSTWGEAYEYAIATAKAQGEPARIAFNYSRFSTELREGAAEAELVVMSAQPYVQLGRPFTPARLATIKVVAR
jgi:hypothetical protein